MASLKKLKIGVLCGGDSSERPVSLRSGRAVFQALARRRFHVRRLDPHYPDFFSLGLSQIDLAFITLHGKGGEDGSVQALLEEKGIPYLGSDAEGSRLAFNKIEAKKIFERRGIPTPPWITFTQKDWKKKLSSFPIPFFVKPIADGSSIGVFLVEDFFRSAEKIMHALEKYGMLLAEQKIEGREFTVGILGKKALPVIELRPKRKFYDYRAKYTRGMTEYLIPAPIPQLWQRRFQQVALQVHKELGLRDFSRIDLIADRKGRPFVLEANTIPGFTEFSLFPKAAREAGLSFEKLCQTLVEMVWNRSGRNGKT